MKLDAIIHKSPTNSFAIAEIQNDRATVHSFAFPIDSGTDWHTKAKEALKREFHSRLRSVKFRAGTHPPITKELP